MTRYGKCNRFSPSRRLASVADSCRSSSRPRGLDAAAIVDGCTLHACWQRTDRNVAQKTQEQTICSETQVMAGDPSKL